MILASMQLAQTDVYYYGYWVYDPVADYYYWFTADVVIVDASWVEYRPITNHVGPMTTIKPQICAAAFFVAPRA